MPQALRRLRPGALVVLAVVATTGSAQVPSTLEDFHVSGTQVGDLTTGAIPMSTLCRTCHGSYDQDNEPHATWNGSLMAHAGRDPLFWAQMATANQDAPSVGYFCLRCHVPMSIVTGHALQTDGSTIDATDRDGVTCQLCHAMVDPIYKPGVSPPEDQAILAGLPDQPTHYGNAMFVLDGSLRRRGPRADAAPPHLFLHSPFTRSGELCVTCHDVGNVAVTLTGEGTYRYNVLGQPTPTEDLAQQFPLERTGTEWRLSSFANGGVDMQGRFGGEATQIIRSCQDCHMPRHPGRAAAIAALRPDVARHDFAGAAVPSLDLIAAHTQGDPAVDQDALARGRAKALDMLARAASLDVHQDNEALRVRVTNETGHKLPTGHIEGRRVWINVRFLSEQGALLAEHGAYNTKTATLDEATTTVYEMHVGLSEDAAAVTGFAAGRTGHMALADTILKDNRIPPRGFANAAFTAAGAPVVGATYADGQHWDEQPFPVPPGATQAEVTLYYQSTPREYIEHLRDGNTTNHWGETLHELWTATGRGAPIEMARATLALAPTCALVASSKQTSETELAAGVVTHKGKFTLPVAGAIDPAAEDVTLTVTDGAGRLFEATLPAGSLQPSSSNGRTFKYEGAGPVKKVKLSLDKNLAKVTFSLTGSGARAMVSGTGTASIRVGGTCYFDTADKCKAKPKNKGTCE